MGSWAARFAQAIWRGLLTTYIKKSLPAGAKVTVMELGSGYNKDAWSAERRPKILARARMLLGVKYVFGAEIAKGAEKPTAVDCSELTEYAFASEGVPMPDGAVNQHAFCKPVKAEAKPCDLGFLKYTSKKTGLPVWHVGIRTEYGTIIHASMSKGKVVEEASQVFEGHEGWLGWFRHPELS